MKRQRYKLISIDQLQLIAQKIFEKDEQILLAYLYGSYAMGTQDEFSDIDIGIVLSEDIKSEPLFFAKLASKIEKAFSYNINIDLRILNDVTPRFLFQILKLGKILYSKDDNFKDEYEIRVLYDYQDIKPMLDLYDRISIMEVIRD